jgi:hypothetical protein
MNEQMCGCGAKLKVKLDTASLASRIRIPLYMQAGTEANFPVDALLPKNDVERKRQHDAGVHLDHERRVY